MLWEFESMRNSLLTCLAVLAATLFSASVGFAQTDQSRIGSEYLPADALATAVLSVSDTMASPAAEMYPTEVADAWCKQNFGIEAQQIKQVKLIVGPPGPLGPQIGLVFSLTADFDLKKANPQLIDIQNAVDIDGKMAYALKQTPDLVVYSKDPRTVLVATADYLPGILLAADGQASGTLGRMAESTPHDGALTAMMVLEPVRPMINAVLQTQMAQMPPQFVKFTRIPDMIDAVLMQVDLDDPNDGMKLVMVAGDEAKAAECLDTLKEGMLMGQQAFLAEMNQVAPNDPMAEATARYMRRLSDHYVEMMTPVQKAEKLTVSVDLSQGMMTQGVLVGLLLPAVQAARSAARRMSSSNNLKMVGLAFHNYHSAFKKLPQNITSKDGEPLLSWRVAILPFMDQAELYRQFKLDEPWDSPHNIKLLDKMPEFLRHPAMLTPPGTTCYQRPVGKGFMSPTGELKFRDITDGTSNTILALEAPEAKAVQWTKPDDISINADSPLNSLLDNTRQGFNVVLADGAVRFLSNQIDPEILKALLTRNGAEIINDF